MRSVSLLMSAVAFAIATAQICNLVVPLKPLLPQGLATPYLLVEPDPNPDGNICDQSNTNTQAFVQGAIINTDTGAISVYNPLVINNGTQPAITPTPPTLPNNRVVALWFGFNGNQLTLVNTENHDPLAIGKCVNAHGNVLGQFAYCNAPLFFAAANNGIKLGQTLVPALGNAIKGDGKTCPSIRDFMVVDQDQSNGVLTTYLFLEDFGTFAQNTAANRQTLTNEEISFKVISNPSDNSLLANFVDPALGCTPWTVADLADNNNLVNALPLNELQAQYMQSKPQALVPLNSAQTKVNGAQNLQQVNLFRAGVDQPAAQLNFQADPQTYCQNLNTLGASRLLANQAALMAGASPSGNSTNLFSFLQTRFRTAIGANGLGCNQFNITSAV